MTILVMLLLATNPVPFKIIEIEKDIKAPFKGFLVNPPAMAKILSETKEHKEKCMIEKNKIIQEKDLKYNALDKETKARLKIIAEKHEKLIKIKDEEIHKYKTNYNPKKPKFFGTSFYTGLVIGVVTSVLLTYGSMKLYSTIK